jgi:hypothetical protein
VGIAENPPQVEKAKLLANVVVAFVSYSVLAPFRLSPYGQSNRLPFLVSRRGADGVDVVQIRHHSMENMDMLDKMTPTGRTQWR